LLFISSVEGNIPKEDDQIYKLALYQTLNGNPKQSNFLLKEISLKKKHQDKKNFLHAYNYFLLEKSTDFSKHLDLIKNKDFDTMKKKCILEINENIIFNKEFSYRSCLKKLKSSTLFLDSLASLRKSNNDYIQELLDVESKNAVSIDSVKRILKTALYTGNEEFILDYLTLFPKKIFKYSSIRELLGLIFFRLRDFNKAEKLIKPVDTTNAKNILGNIEIEKGNIEIAFGYFLEAYKKDITSTNAVKRLIPLTWKLAKFSLLSKVLKTFPNENHNNLLIQSATLLKQKKFKESLQKISLKNKRDNYNSPIIFSLLKLVLNIHLDRDIETYKLSKDSCKRNNPIACDILFYMRELNSVKKIKEYLTGNFNRVQIEIKSLKTEIAINKIDETVLINQKDIEELDDQVQFKKSIKR